MPLFPFKLTVEYTDPEENNIFKWRDRRTTIVCTPYNETRGNWNTDREGEIGKGKEGWYLWTPKKGELNLVEPDPNAQPLKNPLIRFHDMTDVNKPSSGVGSRPFKGDFIGVQWTLTIEAGAQPVPPPDRVAEADKRLKDQVYVKCLAARANPDRAGEILIEAEADARLIENEEPRTIANDNISLGWNNAPAAARKRYKRDQFGKPIQ